MKTILIAAASALVLSSGAALLPATASAATIVIVVLQDPSTGNGVTTMQIVPTPDAVQAGKATFRISNQSKSLVHEMLLLQAPATGKLPYDEKTQRVIESQTVKLVDSGEIKPGASLTASTTLKPGKYLMICNQPTHYVSGMKAPFTVTP